MLCSPKLNLNLCALGREGQVLDAGRTIGRVLEAILIGVLRPAC